MISIGVVGTGYVGLVSGACLAEAGHNVTCFDLNSEVISSLQEGVCHIYEPGLTDLLSQNTERLSFCELTDKNEDDLANFDVLLIAVGTPTSNGAMDLSYVGNVSRSIGRAIKNTEKFISIIVKSTVLPGTTDTFVRSEIEQESGKTIGDFGLGMNPEFLREGSAITDFQNPDRIVFGYEDTKTLRTLHAIYASWSCEKIELNCRSAEMMKYVNNSLLATLISTTNEYANIARAIGGIDFGKVIHGVHMDNRWSPMDKDGVKVLPKILDYLKPGCGYGGSCFPKDVSAFAGKASEVNSPTEILSAVMAVNERQPDVMLSILKQNIESLDKKSVLMLGLAFKPETDDVRESVSIKLLRGLAGTVKSVTAHDPVAICNARAAVGPGLNVVFVNDWISALGSSDIVIIATNWHEYERLVTLDAELSGKVIFDTRSFLQGRFSADIEYLTVT